MIEERKNSHLKICEEMDVEFQETTTLLEDVRLVHEALAEADFGAIDLSTRFLGRAFKAPLMISAITGGVKEAEALNRDLAVVAQELGIGFCLGSQRPMLEDPGRAESFRVRRFAPDVLVLGNLGIQQAAAVPAAKVAELVESIEADGIAIHLNPAMELSQGEGDRKFPDGARVLRELRSGLRCRLIVKETGCGISRGVAEKLKSAGVEAVDVAGAGGTSWARVENLRRGADPGERNWLDEWGIPTAASLVSTRGMGFELAASGGLRSGLDAAKCLALGADVCGMALPVLRAYGAGGREGALRFLRMVIDELRAVMLLVGARDIAALKAHKPVITGKLREWMDSSR